MSSSILLRSLDGAAMPSIEQLRIALESKNDSIKIEAMRNILVSMLNGESMSSLLMHVIRFVMPTKNKLLKKLLYYYYEVSPRYTSENTLRQEFILACNSIRNDLQHPNEYISGNTLRFVCRLTEPELIEPLIPTVTQLLEHRHAYVRKNAVWAISMIHKVSECLIPDAGNIIYDYLESELDVTCKRNAFIALYRIDKNLVGKWLHPKLDSILSMEESLLLVIIDFLKREYRVNPESKKVYLQVLFNMLEVDARMIVYEAAVAVIPLTNKTIVLKTAASKLIELISKQSDNNVKLIMLQRIEEIRLKQESALEDVALEILQVLNTTDVDVRKMAIRLVTRIVNAKNVDDVVSVLKSELRKLVSTDKDAEYRKELTKSINESAIRYPKVAIEIVDLLMISITDFSTASPFEVMSFVKEIFERFPNLRKEILHKLYDVFLTKRSNRIYRGALWLIGEYCDEPNEIDLAWGKLRESIGEVPILDSEQRELDRLDDLQEEKFINLPTEKQYESKVKILPDGTYATENAQFESAIEAKFEAFIAKEKPPIRSLILEGDYFLATILCNTILKLTLKYSSTDNSAMNSLKAEAMLIMSSIIRVSQSKFAKQPIDEDSLDQIMSYLRMLTESYNIEELKSVMLQESKDVFRKILANQENKVLNVDQKLSILHVETPLDIRQIQKSDGIGAENEDLEMVHNFTSRQPFISDLNTIKQLTGFSDPIYCEAFVRKNQFDVVLDFMIVNRTKETLQNVTLNLTASGDLKILDRSLPQNLGPHTFLNIQSTVKVLSTDTGSIFGSISFMKSNLESSTVIIDDIQINILDYILPADCSEDSFRKKWVLFEWENKIIIKQNDMNISPYDYLEMLMKRTNLRCLTPQSSLTEDCCFLSANLYAKSVFGEDALMNISLEKQEGKPVSGHVRIRSKNQGIAANIGELINA